jgi:hypothetical protein
MKRSLLIAASLVTLTVGSVFAQEFRTTPRVRPQIAPRPSVEEGSNSSVVEKFIKAHNKFQLINPFAPKQYGSGREVVQTDPRDRDPEEKPRFLKLLSFTF